MRASRYQVLPGVTKGSLVNVRAVSLPPFIGNDHQHRSGLAAGERYRRSGGLAGTENSDDGPDYSMIDCAGCRVTTVSACRCTTFQVPSSDLKIIVTRRAIGVTSSLPPTLAFARSTRTM